MAVRNIKLTISYDGLDYSGWQRQPGRRTIQGELERAIGELTGQAIELQGTSRTDAGVSALGQVANFIIDSPIPTENFSKALNQRLPRDIVVTCAEKVDADFDASTCAKAKLYHYTIFTGRRRKVLQRNYWHRPGELDVERMNKAAGVLAGTHDFKSFAAAADTRKDSVRTVSRCEVTSEKRWIYVHVQADRFLYNMVRNIVGTLVEVGRGRWPAEKVKEILDARDRRAAGPIAPAEGLCLIEVQY